MSHLAALMGDLGHVACLGANPSCYSRSPPAGDAAAGSGSVADYWWVILLVIIIAAAI